MRSNDAFLGLPHDVFCFTMLQEIVARTLSIEVGNYKHVVGSLHLYEQRMRARDDSSMRLAIAKIAMPPMPAGNPWPRLNPC